PPAGAPRGSSIEKSTGTRTRPATATPSLTAGVNFHFFTAASVTSSNTPAGSDFSTRAAAALPSGATSTITTTLPVTLSAAALAGYCGGASSFERTSTDALASALVSARAGAAGCTNCTALPLKLGSSPASSATSCRAVLASMSS